MINVTKTYLPNRVMYKKYVDEIFDSNWITNRGKMVQTLEKKLEKYLNVKNLLLVSNGTMALQVAYKLLNLKGDIITTPFSFVATTSSIVWEGLNPVFVDINRNSLCIDADKIKEKITDKTSAIVATHVYGNCCDVNKIKEIADENNLKVIYDAAHGFNVTMSGKSILDFGDISTLSFHATKIFHTIEGGALIIKDDDLYEKAKKIINFGFSSKGTIECLGINAKMNEFQGAMGLCLLEEVENQIKKRKHIYYKYRSKLKGTKHISIYEYEQGLCPNYSYFPIILDSEELLLKVISKLNDNHINPRRYFYPSLNNLEYVKKQKMEISEDISKRILCLPIYGDLEEECVEKIICVIKECTL